MRKLAERRMAAAIPFRRILYSICFCMFCVIDQRIRTAYGENGWLETFRDLTGAVMAVLILSHYRLDDFRKRKIPYLIWTAAGVMGGGLALLRAARNNGAMNHWIVIFLDVLLFGYIIIHMVIDFAVEKKRVRLNRKFGFVWLLMMLLMVFSKSDLVWPIFYLIMFGCFYLTDYDKAEREDMLQGMLDGIILSFFLLQGLAFVFRPYDEVRYKGIYFNTNTNALFYVEVLAAVLSKILYTARKNACRWLRLYYWLGAGVVLAFLFMTVGRTGWVTAFVLILVFLWAGKAGEFKKGILKRGLILVLCACLTFPLCFGAARYLPPLFHHPIWYGDEWNENRVHSWDPWDSEKYVKLDDLMAFALGRLWGSIEMLLGQSPFLLKAQAEEGQIRGISPSYDAKVGMDVRWEIYRYYLSHLTLWGNAKKGNQEWGYHGHNIFLQFGTDFGIVALGFFMVLCGWGLISFVRRFLKDRDEEHIVWLLFLLNTLVYGLLENVWGAGSITVLLMFFSWGSIIRLDRAEESD